MTGLYGKDINKLIRLIKAKQLTHWQYDQEDGHVDPSKLTRVVVNPAMPMTFIREQFSDFKNTAIGFVVADDNDRFPAIVRFLQDFIKSFERVNGILIEVFGVKPAKSRLRKLGKSLGDFPRQDFSKYDLGAFFQLKPRRKIIVDFAGKIKDLPEHAGSFSLIDAEKIRNDEDFRVLLDRLYTIFA